MREPSREKLSVSQREGLDWVLEGGVGEGELKVHGNKLVAKKQAAGGRGSLGLLGSNSGSAGQGGKREDSIQEKRRWDGSI